jgi:hypothetical protein
VGYFHVDSSLLVPTSRDFRCTASCLKEMSGKTDFSAISAASAVNDYRFSALRVVAMVWSTADVALAWGNGGTNVGPHEENLLCEKKV